MIITGPDGKDRNTHRGMDTESVTFNNVTITISGARNAGDAYDVLCMALASMEREGIAVEWATDTYTTSAVEDERPTDGLFPAEGSEREKKGRSPAPLDWWIVTLRESGDDEDALHVVQAATHDAAVDTATADFKDEDEDATPEERTIYINHVVCCGRQKPTHIQATP